MTNARSRFFRAMKSCPRVKFYDEKSMPNSYFAIYENMDEHLFVSEDGIFDDKEKIDIKFSNIEAATCLVDDVVLLDGIQLKMKNGENIKLLISGREGRQYDAHLFARFLIRTLEDRMRLL